MVRGWVLTSLAIRVDAAIGGMSAPADVYTHTLLTRPAGIWHLQRRLKARATQIMPAELLAVPLTLLAIQDAPRGRDAFFQSAMAALIRACPMCLVAQC